MGKKLLFLLLVLVISATAGSFAGKFFQSISPEGSAFHNLFGVEEEIGISPTKLDLIIIEFTFGCIFKFNLLSVLFMITGGYIFNVVVPGKKTYPPGMFVSGSEQDSDEKRDNKEQ
jgi:hypothetical protein